MVNSTDNYSKYINELHFEMSIFSSIGERETQQDSCAYSISDDWCMVSIADGMGGHTGGKEASSIVCNTMDRAFEDIDEQTNIPNEFRKVVSFADSEVAGLVNQDGSPMKAGTTLSSVIINDGRMFWCSVGDSRIYLLRNGVLQQITRDHTYKMILDNKLKNKKITENEYVSMMENSEALISFVGMGDITLLDVCEKPIQLENEDKILICSDGLYKLVSDKHIQRIIENFTDLEDALQALNYKAITMDKKSDVVRDNTTLALIRIKL